jgi:sortase A
MLVEGLAWAVGVAALSIWGVAHLAGAAGARQDLKHFETLRQARVNQLRPLTETEPSVTTPERVTQVDGLTESESPLPRPANMALWAGSRVRAWRASLTRELPAPLAILRIPKIGLEVAVLPGTGAVALNRGVGHIADTAVPGGDGNSGIAGHRDGFFRALKDIDSGDLIQLETLAGRHSYRVERTWIVDPQDISVLEPTAVPSLTLVTCYPFYSIGPASERFIVRATVADPAFTLRTTSTADRHFPTGSS